MSFVSVIIPNYNHAPFLKERIDSVLQQTYTDFEVIILDDCSTDNSKEIIETYWEHPKVVHIEYNKHNSGSTFKQWKKGIDLAKGEWIWIAESDDVAEPLFLEKLVSDNLTEDISLIFSKSDIIDEHGKNTIFLDQSEFPNRSYANNFFESSGKIDSRQFVIEKMYRFNQIVNASSVVFRKSAAPMNDSKLERFTLCGDWYFWLRVLSKGNLYYNSETLNHFRAHKETVRVKSELKMFTFFENIEIIRFITDEFRPSERLKSLYLDFIIYIYFNRYPREIRKGNLFNFYRSIKPFGLKGFLRAMKYQLLNNA